MHFDPSLVAPRGVETRKCIALSRSLKGWRVALTW